jgi:hypothetical protein
MTGLRANWEGSEEFLPLPRGFYPAVITGCMFDQTEDKVSFEFTLTNPANRRVWDNIPVETFGWKIRKFFEALEVWTNPDTDDELIKNCQAALNKNVEIEVVQSKPTPAGKIYNNVKGLKLLFSAGTAVTESDIPF